VTTLEALHQSIIEGIGSISGLQQCGPFPRRMDKVTLPAVFVDLAELEPDIDPGTGELALITHWEARVIVAESQPDAQAVQRGLVLAVMHWLFSSDFPTENVGKAKLRQAGPDHFAPEMQGHDVWLIEWTQQIRVGGSVWDGAGVIPTQVFLGTGNDSDEVTRGGDSI